MTCTFNWLKGFEALANSNYKLHLEIWVADAGGSLCGYYENEYAQNITVAYRKAGPEEDQSNNDLENLDAKIEQVVLFPNPSEGLFNLNNLSKNDRIVIYDQTGRIILNRVSLVEQESIDISTEPSGSYLLKVYSGTNEVVSTKILIKK